MRIDIYVWTQLLLHVAVYLSDIYIYIYISAFLLLLYVFLWLIFIIIIMNYA